METIRIPQYTFREFALFLALSVLCIPFGEWITRFEPSPNSRRYELVMNAREPVGYGISAISIFCLAMLSYQVVTGKAGTALIDLTPTELLDNRSGLSIPWGSVRALDYPELPPDRDAASTLFDRIRRLRARQTDQDYLVSTLVVLIHWVPAESVEEEWDRYPLSLPTSMRGATHVAQLRAVVEQRTGLRASPTHSAYLSELIRKDAVEEVRRRYL